MDFFVQQHSESLQPKKNVLFALIFLVLRPAPPYNEKTGFHLVEVQVKYWEEGRGRSWAIGHILT